MKLILSEREEGRVTVRLTTPEEVERETVRLPPPGKEGEKV